MRYFLMSLLFAQLAFAQVDTRNLSISPKEIYGDQKAEIKIKIGNGGAGPTGVIKALAEDYLKMSGEKFAIAWYQDISVNTLEQLKKGVINVALVYEKAQAQIAQNEGWATNYTPVFNDHFLIVGPKNNPAHILNSDSAITAFVKIAKYAEQSQQKAFLSRDDNSGTNVKERSIWTASGFSPWQGNKTWYHKLHVFPKDALLAADKMSLYTITDQGTWLPNKAELQKLEVMIFGGSTLLNPCFALLGKKPDKEAIAFLNYLKSDRAQKLIAEFGKDRFNGSALFTPANQADF